MTDDKNTPDLRHLFGEAPTPAIDVAEVARRSRARRVPKVLGIGAAGVLALGGFGVIGVQALGATQFGGATSQIATDAGAAAPLAGSATSGDVSSSEGAMSSGTSGGAIKRAPADRINLCTGTLAEVAPSQLGLTLAVDFANGSTGTAPIEGTVTMTNTSSATIVGYTAASPAITLSRDGIVLWHSNGPMIALAAQVDLAPGESMTYQASFTPVKCGVDDDLAEGFSDSLPALPAGDYQVSAAIDVMGDFAADLVTSPTETVTLH